MDLIRKEHLELSVLELEIEALEGLNRSTGIDWTVNMYKESPYKTLSCEFHFIG